MGEILLGCSGWNYGDTPDKGGWTGVFYPDKDTKRLRYYSQFFNTAEMDSIFYERFYSQMTKGTFIGMVRATPDKFQFSVKVPETVTHNKRLDVNKGAMRDFEEFLDKISPLKTANKLGTILIQLPPSFTVNDFKNIEGFLDRLPSSSDYDYAVEFRHPSWSTEGPWDMLRHYNIAAVMTDSPTKENLQFLSNVTITTANHSFIRFHGRNTKGHYWYNYIYSKEELKPWIEKVSQIKQETKVLRIYFNNHYGGKAVINALQLKEMTSTSLSDKEVKALEQAQSYLSNKMLSEMKSNG
ncbi:MAG TPA: DUF72 domain-containing protein [Nitrososphaeraceae archaeon]|jgi:uncharacterized protein YecE (DUF72 family)|nr:DUF72 domain-containing protein [Nitrososphaeraceae archaeon]